MKKDIKIRKILAVVLVSFMVLLLLFPVKTKIFVDADYELVPLIYSIFITLMFQIDVFPTFIIIGILLLFYILLVVVIYRVVNVT
jgi:hypothetical protein